MPLGLYDVQVTNPDGSAVIVPYRFLVETANPIDLTIGVGGPGHLELGETGLYGISVQNTTNVDLPYVHLVFSVPRIRANAPISSQAMLVLDSNLRGEANLSSMPWAQLTDRQSRWTSHRRGFCL